jgi:hypothetical protein
MQALYRGDKEEAARLLPADEELRTDEAAAFGRVERLRALLDENAERVGESSPDGFTPLHLAIFGGSLEAAGLLIERGADPRALDGVLARSGRSGRRCSSARCRSRAALDAGADPNGSEEDGSTGSRPPFRTTTAS